MANKVLIAVDGSEHSDAAFKHYAGKLHKPENEVILLYCPELTNVTLRMLKGESPPYSIFEKKWEEEQQEWKAVEARYNAMAAAAHVSAVFKVEPAQKPGEAIVTVAEEEKVDTIITGTRGMGTLRRTIMGSVSDFVVHHASCTVIVYRSPS